MPYQKIVNLCVNGGSGMSKCDLAGQNYEQHKACSFCHGRSSGGNWCENLKYEKYCGSVAAQKHSKGEPILLSDAISDETPIEDILDQWDEVLSDFIDEECEELDLEDLASLIEEENPVDEEADFHEFLEAEGFEKEHMIEPVDREMYYTGPDGKLRRVGSYDHMLVMSDKVPDNPCHKCAKEDCDAHIIELQCPMKRKYETYMLQAKKRGASIHMMTEAKRPSAHTHKWPSHCIEHSDPEHTHSVVVKLSEEKEKASGNIYAREMYRHEMMHEQVREYNQNREVTVYINSRHLSRGAIMERYNEDLMIVVSNKTPGFPERFFSKDKSLLLDKEYLVFYDEYGEISYPETRRFLDTIACSWRRIVPKAALPKYKDYAADFGFRRVYKRPIRTIEY